MQKSRILCNACVGRICVGWAWKKSPSQSLGRGLMGPRWSMRIGSKESPTILVASMKIEPSWIWICVRSWKKRQMLGSGANAQKPGKGPKLLGRHPKELDPPGLMASGTTFPWLSTWPCHSVSDMALVRLAPLASRSSPAVVTNSFSIPRISTSRKNGAWNTTAFWSSLRVNKRTTMCKVCALRTFVGLAFEDIGDHHDGLGLKGASSSSATGKLVNQITSTMWLKRWQSWISTCKSIAVRSLWLGPVAGGTMWMEHWNYLRLFVRRNWRDFVTLDGKNMKILVTSKSLGTTTSILQAFVARIWMQSWWALALSPSRSLSNIYVVNRCVGWDFRNIHRQRIGSGLMVHHWPMKTGKWVNQTMPRGTKIVQSWTWISTLKKIWCTRKCVKIISQWHWHAASCCFLWSYWVEGPSFTDVACSFHRWSMMKTSWSLRSTMPGVHPWEPLSSQQSDGTLKHAAATIFSPSNQWADVRIWHGKEM